MGCFLRRKKTPARRLCVNWIERHSPRGSHPPFLDHSISLKIDCVACDFQLYTLKKGTRRIKGDTWDVKSTTYVD